MPHTKHSDVIDVMQSLGYSINKSGVCHGIATMGIQAFLVGEMEKFK